MLPRVHHLLAKYLLQNFENLDGGTVSLDSLHANDERQLAWILLLQLESITTLRGKIIEPQKAAEKANMVDAAVVKQLKGKSCCVIFIMITYCTGISILN